MQEKIKWIDESVKAEEHIKKYYEQLAKKISKQFEIAGKAKEKGLDVENVVESTPAVDLADRCENMIGPEGIAKRYREVIKEMSGNRIKTIFQLFKEIIEEKWIKIPNKAKRLEQAVKTSLVLITEGVVVAPIDGVPSVKISKNFDGSEYVDIYFAGPIRAAGGTATVFPLILGDYARKLMNLDRYKPTDDEVERCVEETKIYDEIFSRQYKLKTEEVRKIVKGCPVCINGEPTEQREVTAYKNLERIPSNRVRGGMCLVISEGVALKAAKIMALAKMIGLDWSWLESIIKVSKTPEQETKAEPSLGFLQRIAAGRPIFSYPDKVGGFRVRYGRARNTGTMAKAINPATMYLLDEFIAVGTQIKIEKPGKSAGIFPCETIEGPIVKLLNGDVVKVNSVEEALKIKNSVQEILFLGDILITYGDFKQTAHNLLPAGYCIEWWLLELKKALSERKTLKDVDVKEIFKSNGKVDCFTAVEISMQTGIPLHPDYIHFYSALNVNEFAQLTKIFKKAEKKFEGGRIISAEVQNEPLTKGLLEKICIPHKVTEKNIIIEKDQAYAFLKTVGALSGEKKTEGENVLEILTGLSGIKIRDKSGTFIGTRMGRPETSKPRKMAGNPHVLFPLGMAGGNVRSINKAIGKLDERKQKQGIVNVEISVYECPQCKSTVPFYSCPDCGVRTTRLYWCGKCFTSAKEDYCRKCNAERTPFKTGRIDLETYIGKAVNNLKMKLPETVKGVKGLINQNKIPERLEKGILRAHNDLHIFRDGTIRYELLNAPLTHFKPAEISMSIKKAKELGYLKDINENQLTSPAQTLEIMPQDIVINEEAGEFFVRVSKFVDELLERFYGLPRLYNLNSKEELIGEVVFGLAPHTSAAVLGRIIGYTKARVCFAHPYFHQTKRRNIDGDQDSLMLSMDCFLNFSMEYLSSSRGGRMDAPLSFTVMLNPTEIDDEVHNMECCKAYDLDFYEKTLEMATPKLEKIETVKNRLGSEYQYSNIYYTHETEFFDAGPKISRYVQLKTMEEKLAAQVTVQNKIRAVDKKDALERVLASHFLPDLIGNARGFSRQVFRCSKCNMKFRRIPLVGHCTRCEGNIILTIAEGSVKKYLNIAKQLISNYGLSDYLKQRLNLIEKEIAATFAQEETSQKSLFEYV